MLIPSYLIPRSIYYYYPNTANPHHPHMKILLQLETDPAKFSLSDALVLLGAKAYDDGRIKSTSRPMDYCKTGAC